MRIDSGGNEEDNYGLYVLLPSYCIQSHTLVTIDDIKNAYC